MTTPSIAAKQFIIMRHAKTESFASSDHVRELTERGKRDSRAAGQWLSVSELVPDCIVVSSAARARGTVDQLCEAMGKRPEVIVLDELYGADEYDVLALCAATVPGDSQIALVVGHNPTMAMTAWLIQPEEARADTYFPTSGIAVFEIDAEWSELDPGVGTLVATHTPHDS
jgi:phosphohistidine phosphatase